jgi:hypothetical protein
MLFAIKTEEYFRGLLEKYIVLEVLKGFKTIYSDAVQVVAEDTDRQLEGKVLKVFQKLLKTIPTWSQDILTKETARIRNGFTGDVSLDDLLKAIIKANMVILSNNNPELSLQYLAGPNKFHDTVKLEQFVHQLYIECARKFYMYPELFFTDVPPIESNKNTRESLKIIEECYNQAVRKMIPLNMTLKMYLNDNYMLPTSKADDNTLTEAESNNLKKMMKAKVNDALKMSGFSEQPDFSDRHQMNMPGIPRPGSVPPGMSGSSGVVTGGYTTPGTRNPYEYSQHGGRHKLPTNPDSLPSSLQQMRPNLHELSNSSSSHNSRQRRSNKSHSRTRTHSRSPQRRNVEEEKVVEMVFDKNRIKNGGLNKQIDHTIRESEVNPGIKDVAIAPRGELKYDPHAESDSDTTESPKVNNAVDNVQVFDNNTSASKKSLLSNAFRDVKTDKQTFFSKYLNNP